MHHILCESPFKSRDLYAIRPLILRHILGAYFFANMGGGGGQNLFSFINRVLVAVILRPRNAFRNSVFGASKLASAKTPLLNPYCRLHGLIFLTFFCASFFPFFCPVHPTLPQAIFFRKILSSWNLRSTLSSREKATSRGWVLGMVQDGVAASEKRKILFFVFFFVFLWRAKKGEFLRHIMRATLSVRPKWSHRCVSLKETP